MTDATHHNIKIVYIPSYTPDASWSLSVPVSKPSEEDILKTLRAKNLPPEPTYYESLIDNGIYNSEWIYPSDTSQAPYKEFTIHLNATQGGYWDLSTGLTGKDYYINRSGEERWNELNEEAKNFLINKNYDYQVLGTIGGPVIQKEIYVKDFEDKLKATMLPAYKSELTIGEEFKWTNADGESFPEGYKEAHINRVLATPRSPCINAGTKIVDGKTLTYAGGDGGKLGESGKQGENNGEKGTAPIVD